MRPRTHVLITAHNEDYCLLSGSDRNINAENADCCTQSSEMKNVSIYGSVQSGVIDPVLRADQNAFVRVFYHRSHASVPL
jgi:hypothetical protein